MIIHIDLPAAEIARCFANAGMVLQWDSQRRALAAVRRASARRVQSLRRTITEPDDYKVGGTD